MTGKKRPLRAKSVRRAKPLILDALYLALLRWWQKSGWNRILAIFLAFMMVLLGTLYGIGQWYALRHAHEPLVYGASFIPRYARDFGLDPQETLRAVIDDLGVKRLRLVSYWDDGEPAPGIYDFSELDWQFQMAEAKGAKISLALGLRQPRWPECHMPEWANGLPKAAFSATLQKYMRATIERYQDSPALLEYQLENEFHFTIFTRCADNDPARLQAEYDLIRSVDPHHPIQMSLSGDFAQAIGEPVPDRYGMALYKRLYEPRFLKRYFEYPFPSWLYSYRAGIQELLKNRDSFIHELQMEPWGPGPILQMSIEEQDKSMDAKRLRERFAFSQSTGLRTLDIWGVEWWYWRKTKLNDPSVWASGKAELANIKQLNAAASKARAE